MMIPPPSASSSQNKSQNKQGSSSSSRSLGVHKCYFLVTVIVAVAVLLLLNTTVRNISNTTGTRITKKNQLPASLSNSIQSSSLPDDVIGNDLDIDLDLDINYTALLQKWKLPVSAEAVAVLHEIRTKPKFQYNPRQDILGFHHPLKSGGTSLSLMLKELVGGNHAVMPGSGPSGWFNFGKFEQAMQQYPPPPLPNVVASPTNTNEDVRETTNTTAAAAAAVASYEYWNQISVLYTHSYLRPKSSPNSPNVKETDEMIVRVKESIGIGGRGHPKGDPAAELMVARQKFKKHRETMTEPEMRLGSYAGLITALDEDERYQEAMELYKTLVAESRQILGPDHPDTQNYENKASKYREKMHVEFLENSSVLTTKRGYIFQYLRTQVPQLAKKRFRLLTIVRRPVDLAASRFSETTCGVMTHTPGMRKAKTPAECPVVNLTDVAARKKKAVCQSIDHFMASKTHLVHNQYYKTIMGAVPEPPSQLPRALEERTIEKNTHKQNPTDPVAKMTNDTAFTTSTIAAVADAAITRIAVQTLRDFGGLLPYNTKTQEEDFVWFGITERFTESMCVFYYTFYPHFNYTQTNEKKNR